MPERAESLLSGYTFGEKKSQEITISIFCKSPEDNLTGPFQLFLFVAPLNGPTSFSSATSALIVITYQSISVMIYKYEIKSNRIYDFCIGNSLQVCSSSS